MLSKINDWLLLLSHLGIIGGLILVALQIKQNSQMISLNTTAIRSQELSSLMDAQTQLDTAIMGENLSSSYAKALMSPSEMDSHEILEASIYLAARVNMLARSFDAYQAGIVNRHDWEQQLGESSLYLETPFGQVFWNKSKSDYLSHEFVAAVEGADVPPASLTDEQWLREIEAEVRGLGNGQNE